jgi:cyclin C
VRRACSGPVCSARQIALAPLSLRAIQPLTHGAIAEFLGLDTSKLGECEFYMISELNSQLIIHQPYRTLTALQGDLQLTTDESSMAWSVINDSYMTDLPLLYPPHIIAVTAILLGLVCKPLAPGANPGGVNGQGSGAGQGTSSSSATSGSSTIKQAAAVLSQAQIQGSSGAPLSGGAAGGQGPAHMAGQGQKERAPGNGKITRFASWLADSNIELEAIVDTTHELISFYEEHEQYVDVRQREVMNRFVKARGFEK